MRSAHDDRFDDYFITPMGRRQIPYDARRAQYFERGVVMVVAEPCDNS